MAMSGSSRMVSMCRKTGLNVELQPFTEKIPINGFMLTLKVEKCEPEQYYLLGDGITAGGTSPPRANVELRLRGERTTAAEEGGSGSRGYELIVDYKLIVETHLELVEKDLWQAKEEEEILLTIRLDSCSIAFIDLAVNVRDTLVPEDLSVSNSFRNFNILSADRSFYVNTKQLVGLGGKMFKEWHERDCQGEENAVVQSLNVEELEELLKACCSYSTPVVHRRNFHALMEIADKERIAGMLRLLESFLIESQSIHPIRKLEYAAEYRMTRLASAVLKSFPNRLARLDSLFGYLAESGEDITDVHLDVLEMLEIRPDHIIL